MKTTETKDKTRNNRFAEAVDHLKRNGGITSQLGLARMMGVDKNTISNIINYKTYVTDDVITKLQTASGCIFNLQWLRGESDIMFEIDARKKLDMIKNVQVDASHIDASSMINAMIASKDETIAEKDRRLAEKDVMIAEKDKRIAEKDERITELKQQLAELKGIYHYEKQSDRIGKLPFATGVADEPMEL